MKKTVAFVLVLIAIMAAFSACGKTYTCVRCEEQTSKAYYDLSASKQSVMCEDCARSYWMPMDYKRYRVK